jgi:hypothetical protein
VSPTLALFQRRWLLIGQRLLFEGRLYILQHSCRSICERQRSQQHFTLLQLPQELPNLRVVRYQALNLGMLSGGKLSINEAI